ncbi:MAG TPA: hypothetical protein VG936_10890 [Lacunisphaera sp.]|nr:hypothetical protein [Lacunisphaera sp.]
MKKKKEHLQKTRSAFWIEPAKAVVNALELAGKQQAERSPEAVSGLVQKIGTNRLIARKKVTAGFAQPFDVIAQILAELRREFADNELPHGYRSKTCLVHQISRSSIWCPGQDSNL